MFRFIGYILLIIHIFLWIWSVGGMFEWLLPAVPWMAYSNDEFPRLLLFFHWSVVIFASTGFLYGYFTRWHATPDFMIIGYGLMAVICVIETFGYMTNETKYLAMGLEFTAYIIIIFILRHGDFRALHFNTRPAN